MTSITSLFIKGMFPREDLLDPCFVFERLGILWGSGEKSRGEEARFVELRWCGWVMEAMYIL
jgi:hypothetical protein